MGCNCSKGGRKPHGSTTPKPSQQQIQREGAKTQSFILQTNTGQTQSFSRKLDADAARVRNGGTVRPA